MYEEKKLRLDKSSVFRFRIKTANVIKVGIVLSGSLKFIPSHKHVMHKSPKTNSQSLEKPVPRFMELEQSWALH